MKDSGNVTRIRAHESSASAIATAGQYILDTHEEYEYTQYFSYAGNILGGTAFVGEPMVTAKQYSNSDLEWIIVATIPVADFHGFVLRDMALTSAVMLLIIGLCIDTVRRPVARLRDSAFPVDLSLETRSVRNLVLILLLSASLWVTWLVTSKEGTDAVATHTMQSMAMQVIRTVQHRWEEIAASIVTTASVHTSGLVPLNDSSSPGLDQYLAAQQGLVLAQDPGTWFMVGVEVHYRVRVWVRGGS